MQDAMQKKKEKKKTEVVALTITDMRSKPYVRSIAQQHPKVGKNAKEILCLLRLLNLCFSRMAGNQ